MAPGFPGFRRLVRKQRPIHDGPSLLESLLHLWNPRNEPMEFLDAMNQPLQNQSPEAGLLLAQWMVLVDGLDKRWGL